VRAVRDSDLLELDGDAFLAMLGRDPDVSVALATSLARQLQRSGGLSEPSARPSVVAVTSTAGVEARGFWDDLRDAFAAIGPTVGLGRPDGGDWSARLAALERMNAFVLLRASDEDPAWGDFCLRQADRVVVITQGPPPKGASLPDGCDVVFVDGHASGALAAWRQAVAVRAHHVVPPGDGSAAGRVARRLCGRSVGLVLSGGGARAFAHLGVFEVLSAEGVEFDRAGGTSMGAYIAAMVALGWTPDQMIKTCREEVAQRSPFSDYTLPRYALIRARRAETMLRRTFGDAAMEDLPRPLFAVSADLVDGSMVVHREGELWEAVGTSMTLPGLAPPRPHESQLLIDGGILNNLPVDVMVADDPGLVVAVDVMRRVTAADLQPTARASLPTIVETLARASVLGSIARAEGNRGLAAVVIAPDVQDVSLRDFRRIQDAIDAGRRTAEEMLAAGKLDLLLASGDPAE
jgi:predicted acylesterase/phospholipase RssA